MKTRPEVRKAEGVVLEAVKPLKAGKRTSSDLTHLNDEDRRALVNGRRDFLDIVFDAQIRRAGGAVMKVARRRGTRIDLAEVKTPEGTSLLDELFPEGLPITGHRRRHLRPLSTDFSD